MLENPTWFLQRILEIVQFIEDLSWMFFNSSAGLRAAGEQAHLPAAAAAARGNTEEGSSEPPRRLSAGAGGRQRRGPDGRFPELLLRSSVLTAVPGNQRRNCHSQIGRAHV